MRKFAHFSTALLFILFSFFAFVQGAESQDETVEYLQLPTQANENIDKHQLFAEANYLYAMGDFDSALTLYRKVLELHGQNSAILYNISNTAFRLGNIAEAILYLERARLLSPRSADILANLNFLRTQTTDVFIAPEQNFAQKFIDDLQNLMTVEAQVIVVLVLSFIMLLILAFTLFCPKFRNIKIYAFMILGFLSLILGISATQLHNYRSNNVRVVVMADGVAAMNEPRGNTLIFTVNEGTVLRLMNTSGDWYFVSLPNGVSGWVLREKVERI